MRIFVRFQIYFLGVLMNHAYWKIMVGFLLLVMTKYWSQTGIFWWLLLSYNVNKCHIIKWISSIMFLVSKNIKRFCIGGIKYCFVKMVLLLVQSFGFIIVAIWHMKIGLLQKNSCSRRFSNFRCVLVWFFVFVWCCYIVATHIVFKLKLAFTVR